ncbi:MerR family transcriptional regulator [Alcanivorax sp. DP30]|uniref:MerR family transcriptional regulator n=1 Tax=Alcanivorax sp. DP30 TaxID=2606217 RepID=UPI00136B0D4E|nr:MerR family transcriptional regulator [Alcanivorax sp. DP30]MZR62257.1 MerR family transcriptional regulator [Alcanivorax sp. DP30]
MSKLAVTMNADDSGYSIQAVSERCGVNPVTLRAWERRYGLLKPSRTAKGHRRYSEQQLARVQAVVQWLEKGVPIRQVQALLDSSSSADVTAEPVWQEAREDALASLEALNLRRLEQQLNGLIADYGHGRVIAEFSDPLREQLAISSSLSLQAALFHSLLTQKWSGRALSLAPGRTRSGWILVPLGDPLAALELAMVMNSPLWCLDQPADYEALLQRHAAHPHFGIIWLADALPSAAQRARWLPQQAPGVPACIWGPLAQQLATEVPGVSVLTGSRGEVADALQAFSLASREEQA